MNVGLRQLQTQLTNIEIVEAEDSASLSPTSIIGNDPGHLISYNLVMIHINVIYLLHILIGLPSARLPSEFSVYSLFIVPFIA
jgi:hypothetical protein